MNLYFFSNYLHGYLEVDFLPLCKYKKETVLLVIIKF